MWHTTPKFLYYLIYEIKKEEEEDKEVEWTHK